ncbi:MAG TPA: ParA family protein [Geothermobacteraceae bacterium]|nr:ParA family protein [Geothermobacteraceae bacterium]
MQNKLFVVTVASEKGGVGKTTIATNLAVYLKALREDLPVTIASFDNHFSIDNMFAISRSSKGSVAGLLSSKVPHRQVRLGEYGVQYFPSERSLPPLRGKVEMLGAQLAASDLEGVLVLDTRPILDDYTISALLAADLVLVPVKDRASLVNAGALRQARETRGLPAEQFWLVPSLIDGRLRIQGEVGMDEYLRYNAGERNYQVFAGHISKSPKVEGLASGFSSRIPAVITHARGTQVHRQFRALAEFVLRQFDQGGEPTLSGSGLHSCARMRPRESSVACNRNVRSARPPVTARPVSCICICAVGGAGLSTRSALIACWLIATWRPCWKTPDCWCWM